MSDTVRLPVSDQAGSVGGRKDDRSRERRSGFVEDIAGEVACSLGLHGPRDRQRENADNYEKEYLVEFRLV